MSNALYTRSAGADPYALDVDQYTNALQGTIDPGAITFAGPTAAPGAPSVTLAAGGLTGSWQWCAWWLTGVPVGGSGTPNINGGTPAGTATATQTLSSQEAVLTVPASVPSTAVGCAFGRTTSGPGATFYVIPGATVYKTAAGAWPQYTDNTPDSSLTTVVPSTNTTGTPVTFGAGATIPSGQTIGGAGEIQIGGALGTSGTGSFGGLLTAKGGVSATAVDFDASGSGSTAFIQPDSATVFVVRATSSAVSANNQIAFQAQSGATALLIGDGVSNPKKLAGTVAVMDDGSGNSAARTYTSTVATGTAPLAVASTTQVPNLNAQLWGNAKNAAGSVIGSPGTPSGVTSTGVGTSLTFGGNRVLLLGQGTLVFTSTTADSLYLYRSTTGIPASGAAPASGDVAIAVASISANTTTNTSTLPVSVVGLDSGLTNGTTYYYYLASTNGDGTGVSVVAIQL
ncbi:MAG: hypothetical protein ACYCU7_19225 [Acidimicrobiales bacterium]